MAALADAGAVMEMNIRLMTSLEGFDVVIVCCSNEKQADYWQQRLTAAR
jgi:hypothetical protein